MADHQQTTSRKADHIRINLEQDVQSTLSNGLERFQFIHQALPEIDLDQVDTSLVLFNKAVRVPILISSMTGGTPEAELINRRLAEAAQATGVAMGLGSQRAAIEKPTLARTFAVRDVAPDILLFANLGAVQLNYGYDVDQCRRAVEMVEADALILHLNPLQEALQPEGDTRFGGLLAKIETICRKLPVPVIAKEVGWGISEKTARMLVDAGVAGIDVAGAGGTSWAQVELFRNSNESAARVAQAFRGWGIPTADSILQTQQVAPNLAVIASGGLKNGIDLAKCLALGAKLGGFAGLFLKTAVGSGEQVLSLIRELERTLRICMFAAGVSNLPQFDRSVLSESGQQNE